MPALRFLSVLHVRVPFEVDVDGDDVTGGGGDGALRDQAGQLRRTRRDGTGRPYHRCDVLRRREASTDAAFQGGRALRERRGNSAAAAQLRIIAISAWPCQFERSGRQIPDVQYVLRRERTVRAPAQRVQKRAEHADGAR